VFDSLMHIERLLEGHYRDMQVSWHDLFLVTA
jgi:hypothetical protein